MTAPDLTPAVPIPRQCFERGGYVLDAAEGRPERFLISATRALSVAGLSVYPERTGILGDSQEFSRRLGTDVHAATAELDLHGEAIDAADDVQGYLEAWRAYKRDHRFVPWLTEGIVQNDQGWYACRPDRVGRSFDEPVVIDIKTGSMSRHYRLQTAAQAMAVRRTYPQLKAFARAAVELRHDGKYFYREHPKDSLVVDFSQFLAAVTIARYLLDGKDPGAGQEGEDER